MIFERNNWLNLSQKLFHLFNLSEPQQLITFQLNLTDILTTSPEDAQEFKTNPSTYLQSITDQLKAKLITRITTTNTNTSTEHEPDLILLKKVENTQIQVKYIPYTKKIYKNLSQLNSDHVGKWVVITGTVIQAMQKKTLDKSKQFICCQCGKRYRIRTTYQNSYRFELPNSCTNRVQKQSPNNIITQLIANFTKRKTQSTHHSDSQSVKLHKCGSTKFNPIQQGKICIDYQELRVQEQFQFICSGKIPQTLTIILQGNLSASTVFRPGDDLTITGILSYRYKKLSNDFTISPQLIILANSIIIEKSGNYTSQHPQKLDQTSETEMTKIYASFPLNYYSGYSLTSRERILIKQLEFRREIIENFCPAIYGRSIVKLGLLLSLVGGVSLENQSSKIRGHSHVLLVGEPGTGKSVLLKQAAALADRSFFTNGIGTTSAGLSVSYFKEGKDWMIEAGALVLADNGVCCIDQLTLLSKKDQKSLLESMEQQTISSAKASIVAKLNARTTVISACNPIRPGQLYDQDLDLEANTGLSIPLLTRFDMIFIMKDEKDLAEDSEKCQHILSKFCTQKTSKSKPRLSMYQKINLKALLKKCKSYTPQLINHQLLTIYYSEERKRQSKVKTARAFQSLCRIAEAHAKLMFREKTILLDYVTAINLAENNYFSTIEEYYAILDQFNKKYKLNLT